MKQPSFFRRLVFNTLVFGIAADICASVLFSSGTFIATPFLTGVLTGVVVTVFGSFPFVKRFRHRVGRSWSVRSGDV